MRNSPSLKSKSSASHDLVSTCGADYIDPDNNLFRQSYEVVINVDYDRHISSHKIPRWKFSYAQGLAT